MGYTVFCNVLHGISTFITIIQYVIMAYCVLSWIMRPDNRLYVALRNLAMPFIAPFRPLAAKLFMRGFRLDISPILAYFVLSIVNSLIWWLPSLFW